MKVIMKVYGNKHFIIGNNRYENPFSEIPHLESQMEMFYGDPEIVIAEVDDIKSDKENEKVIEVISKNNIKYHPIKFGLTYLTSNGYIENK